MTTHVLATNEMKSNLAAHIRAVAADPRRRVAVGAHRRAEAVLVSVKSALPEQQLHAMSSLAGRALGYEIVHAVSAGSGPPAVGDYRGILSALAERHRREDCLRFIREAATGVMAGTGQPQTEAVRQVGCLVGSAVEPDLEWADLAVDVENAIAQQCQDWQEDESHD
ncbi:MULTISPECIES: hypothetical protein [unclassified Dietzia]|uniref:hypothetical protein n=1 Tax=Dietzia sp. DQ11-44 TaxID=1630637 RepID=UPI0015F9383C|nr:MULTISPECIES: hypothetical protein [unclassified Dietzia]MBB1041828.1 hypothetical protein [Dietzia sp. Cai40]MBB1046068.1 hypothetical protein [Dietzia sp. DQ11-44]